MKKNIFLSFLMAFAAITFISAQDPDKILENHFKAIGQENLLKIETLEATGKATIMGMENPFTMMSKRPNMIKIIVDFQGSEIIQAYDGETVWAINPMTGLTGAVELTGSEAAGIIESADLDGQLWNYQEKGHQLELTGTEDVGGEEAFVLKLTKKNGNIDHYYIDRNSHLILKVRSKAMVNGSEMETESHLSDYRKVKGYMMPFATKQTIGGQTANTIIFEEVKVNEKMDDSIFSKPGNDQ